MDPKSGVSSAWSVVSVIVVRAAMVAMVVSGCSSNDSAKNSNPSFPTLGKSGAGGTASISTTDPGAGGIYLNGGASDAGAPFTVGPQATVCQQDLPFKVPGCSCDPGTPQQACWTGPPNDRHVDHCKDGVQQCAGQGEFAQWGPCEGEQLLCHYPPEHIDGGTTADSGAPPPCTCVPGATIGCDEDCQTLVICSLSGYKTCQPDGTWGACHETTDPDILKNLLGCRNWLHGCLPGNTEGAFTGDCSQAYTCGKAPGEP